MRLAHPPTFPGEIPVPSGRAFAITEANSSSSKQLTEKFNPFNLETESAVEFFGLDCEQATSINQVGKRALTYLMWEIDDCTAGGETVTFAEIAEAENLLEMFPGDREGDAAAIERFKSSQVAPSERVANDERLFVERAEHYIEIASLVVGGNEPLAELLSERYGQRVARESTDIALSERKH